MANALGSSDFALRLTQQCYETGKNLCLSPYSARIALSMALNGARGETLRQMAKVLGYGNSSIDQINQSNLSGMKQISGTLTPEEMLIANSLWLNKSVQLSSSYARKVNNVYRAPVNTINLGDRRSVDMINQWVTKNTNGRIKRMYDRIGPQTLLIIINTVLFQGEWLDPFKPKENVKAAWYGSKGKRSTTTYMTKDEDMEFAQTSKYDMVRLPYNLSRLAAAIKPGDTMSSDGIYKEMELQQTLAMYCILPAPNSSPQKLLGNLTGKSLHEMVARLDIGHAELSLPRFKIDVETELISPLTKMGMPLPFGMGADFSGMDGSGSKGLKIDEAKQKCMVEVNERGTVAAAASGLMVLGINPNPPKIKFNRPFVFLIRHDPTGEILFTGVVNQPQA